MERGQENTELLKSNSCDLIIGCELTLSKHEMWGLQEATLFHINLLLINECIRGKKGSWSDQSPCHPKKSRQGAFVKTHPTDSLGFLLLEVLLVSRMFRVDWFYHGNVEAMFMNSLSPTTYARMRMNYLRIHNSFSKQSPIWQSL